MKIVVKGSTMVKPAMTKASTSLFLSNMDLITPLNYHVRIPFYYRSRPGVADFFDSKVVKVALSRALVEFYPMAGRLMIRNKDDHRIEEIYCNGQGALFVEAESNATLDDLADFAPRPELSLTPPLDYSPGISTFPLLLLQITRFKCGGVCLGIAIDHNLADGFSIFHFMEAWSGLCRGLDIAVAPSVDRRVLASRNPPRPHFTHPEYQAPPTFTHHNSEESIFSVFIFTPHQLSALKANCQHHNYTTFEVFAGHVWRSVSKARGLPENQETRLYIPVDGRRRMRPCLPPGYFGNAVFKATCIALCGELESNPLKFAVHKIHDAIARMDDEYLRSAIDYLELQQGPNLRSMNHNKCPNLGINSWARFGVYDLDFGWKKPDYMGLCGYLPEGTTVVLPSPTKDGSLLYAILLPKDQMHIFKNLLYQDIQ